VINVLADWTLGL